MNPVVQPFITGLIYCLVSEHDFSKGIIGHGENYVLKMLTAVLMYVCAKNILLCVHIQVTFSPVPGIIIITIFFLSFWKLFVHKK